METEYLPGILSSLIQILVVMITIAAGCTALYKRAVVLGIGFLLLGLSGALGVSLLFGQAWLYTTWPIEVAFYRMSRLWLLIGVFGLLAFVLILVGVFKLPKSD